MPDPRDGPRGEAVIDVLATGQLTVHGRIAGSSNATLLATCARDGMELLVVYKPARGERPLWDFPRGLHRREVAAFELSEALGWGVVPETVDRAEGPFGPGSVQRFVPEDGESHYFTLREDPAWHEALTTIAAFDVVANNADRKSGHVLLAEGRLWAIDNGLCFHCEPKLRTVIWDFAGQPLADEVSDGLRRLLADGLTPALRGLLDADEQAEVLHRAESLLSEGCLPGIDSGDACRPYPWPLV